MTRELVVVPHTHWDREWYEPREVFRVRLVHLMDRLLDLLESEPEYCFTLDGQSVMLDDYLEIRPQYRARVAARVKAGQLAVGPFLILMDEFSCDGETMIRNLEHGLAVSRRVGAPMRAAHLPDLFGHVAQMPQILRGFDIAHSVLWRGVPDRVRRHAFAWEAPGGDTVRCQYIFDAYGNALDLFAVPGQLETLAPAYAERTASWYEGEPVLGMLGGDHSQPPADLLSVVRAYNAAVTSPRISVQTLDGYLARFDTTPQALAALPRVYGEMRSHARGNLLPGVFSIRTHLKASMGRAERALEAAERLDLAFGRRDHRALFDTAWYRLVESTAHDSVTGCCVDSTARQVDARIESVEHIARGIVGATVGDLAAHVSNDAHLVFNPSGQARRTQIEAVLHGADGAPVSAGVQRLDALPTVLGDETMATADLPRILRRIHGRELFGQQINAYAWTDDGLRFSVAESPRGVFDLAALTAEIEQRVADDPENRRRWHVETIADPRHRALLAVDVDGLSLAAVSPSDAPAPIDPVRVTEVGLANRSLTATVNADGTVRIETAAGAVIDGALRLVDEGDCGDAYNYGPVDAASAVTEPTSVQIEVLERGPLRGRIRIGRRYDVPRGLDAQRRRQNETVPFDVDTIIELREGESMLRAAITFTNPATDHRLRVLVPTGAHALETSRSAGQYAVTVRGREGEGGWGEFPLPTYAAYRYAAAGTVAVLVRKLTEYELVTPSAPADPQDAQTPPHDVLALTLLRAVGMMSVNVHPLRDEPAGSEMPVPEAQALGTTLRTEIAIMAGVDDDAAVLRESDRYRFDPIAARGAALQACALPRPAVSVAVRGDVVLDSARRVSHATGDLAELRCVNYLDCAAPLGLTADGAWTRTNLAGDVQEEGIDLAACTVPAGRIVTLRRPLAPAVSLGAAAHAEEGRAAHDVAHPEDGLVFRAAVPDDAAGIVRCISGTYGASYTAIVPFALDVGAWREVLAEGRHRLAVAVTDGGEVVAMEGLHPFVGCAAVVENGNLLVEPRWRAHGLMHKVTEAMRRGVDSAALRAVVSRCVTFSVTSQKEAQRGRFAPCALFVGSAGELREQGALKDGAGRSSSMGSALLLGPRWSGEVFLPERHAGMITRILDAVGWTYSVAAVSDVPATSRLHPPEALGATSSAELRVETAGRDLADQVREMARREGVRDRAHCAVMSPLDQPGTAAAVDALERRGFFFGGVMPLGDDARPHLVMQRLLDRPVDYAHIQVLEGFSADIKAYVRDCDPSQ